MTEDRDAFGNTTGGSKPITAAAQSTPDAMPTAPAQPAPAAMPKPRRARRSPWRVGPRIVSLAFRIGLVVMIVAGARAIIGEVRDAANDASSSIANLSPGQAGASTSSANTDFQRTPFAAGSMFRGDNLARALRRAAGNAPAGARAAGLSVFPGYAVVTFKRRSGDATMVSVWAGGRVNRTDAGTAAGRRTFALSSIPLAPMVRYVRARSHALGKRARDPYAVLTDRTTTSISGGQVKITTRPAAGWLIGFEGVPQSKRTAQINLRGARVR